MLNTNISVFVIFTAWKCVVSAKLSDRLRFFLVSKFNQWRWLCWNDHDVLIILFINLVRLIPVIYMFIYFVVLFFSVCNHYLFLFCLMFSLIKHVNVFCLFCVFFFILSPLHPLFYFNKFAAFCVFHMLFIPRIKTITKVCHIQNNHMKYIITSSRTHSWQ